MIRAAAWHVGHGRTAQVLDVSQRNGLQAVLGGLDGLDGLFTSICFGKLWTKHGMMGAYGCILSCDNTLVDLGWTAVIPTCFSAWELGWTGMEWML